MKDSRDSLPWWLRHLTPSFIAFLPMIVALICGVLFALLFPVIQWLKMQF